jgi:cytoskeletal protein RodZ
VVPMLWRPGTVFAAAATPIIVAIVSEALKRPVETVSSVTARRTTRFPPVGQPAGPSREETFDPLAPPTADELERLNQTITTPRRVEHRRLRLTSGQWKLALITGLVAFVVAGAVVTLSEVAIFGDSVTSGQRRTTFFGGSTDKSKQSTPATDQERNDKERERTTPTPTPTPTATPREEEAAPTPTPTVTPTATATPTVTPAPTAPPAQPNAVPTPQPTPAP